MEAVAREFTAELCESQLRRGKIPHRRLARHTLSALWRLLWGIRLAPPLAGVAPAIQAMQLFDDRPDGLGAVVAWVVSSFVPSRFAS